MVKTLPLSLSDSLLIHFFAFFYTQSTEPFGSEGCVLFLENFLRNPEGPLTLNSSELSKEGFLATYTAVLGHCQTQVFNCLEPNTFFPFLF